MTTRKQLVDIKIPRSRSPYYQLYPHYFFFVSISVPTRYRLRPCEALSGSLRLARLEANVI